MEDEEPESKVSESVKSSVYCLVQVGAVDCVVTVAEEKPATSGDKVSMFCVFEGFMLVSLGREVFLCQDCIVSYYR